MASTDLILPTAPSAIGTGRAAQSEKDADGKAEWDQVCT